jgi:predicted HicB family RNase H-like nuclease
MDHRKRVCLLQARVEPELMKRVRLAAIEKDLSVQAFVALAMDAACGRVEKKVTRPAAAVRTAA